MDTPTVGLTPTVPVPGPGGSSPAATTPTPSSTSNVGAGALGQSAAPPLYSSVFNNSINASSLGLSPPRNFGDIEALFSQIATELGFTIDETRQNQTETATQRKLSASEQLTADLNSIASKQATLNNIVFVQIPGKERQIDGHEEGVKYQQDISADIRAEHSEKSGRLADLTEERRDLWNTDTHGWTAAQQAELVEKINKINVDIRVLQDEVIDLANQLKPFDDEIGRLQDLITVLQGEISGLYGTATNLQNSINALASGIFSIAVQLLQAKQQDYGELAADIVNQDAQQFTETLDDVLANIQDLNIDQAKFDDIRIVLEGQPSESQGVAVGKAFTGLLQSLSDIVATLKDLAGSASTTAGTLALNAEGQRVRLGI